MNQIEKQIKEHFGSIPNKLLFTEHHEAHAASAFFASYIEEKTGTPGCCSRACARCFGSMSHIAINSTLASSLQIRA